MALGDAVRILDFDAPDQAAQHREALVGGEAAERAMEARHHPRSEEGPLVARDADGCAVVVGSA